MIITNQTPVEQFYSTQIVSGLSLRPFQLIDLPFVGRDASERGRAHLGI